jgi:hypothetical protein
MSRSNKNLRWTAAVLLAGAVAIGAAGCVAVPVGGGYAEPGIAFPAPGVVITPPPIVFGPAAPAATTEAATVSPIAAIGGAADLGRPRRHSNCAALHLRAAPKPSFSRISSNFIPTSVRAA